MGLSLSCPWPDLHLDFQLFTSLVLTLVQPAQARSLLLAAKEILTWVSGGLGLPPPQSNLLSSARTRPSCACLSLVSSCNLSLALYLASCVGPASVVATDWSHLCGTQPLQPLGLLSFLTCDSLSCQTQPHWRCLNPRHHLGVSTLTAFCVVQPCCTEPYREPLTMPAWTWYRVPVCTEAFALAIPFTVCPQSATASLLR